MSIVLRGKLQHVHCLAILRKNGKMGIIPFRLRWVISMYGEVFPQLAAGGFWRARGRVLLAQFAFALDNLRVRCFVSAAC